jgi:F-box protein 11
MSGTDLQERLDRLAPGQTLTLEPAGREFQGPLVIRHPVVIEGQGGTIWAPRGPVLTIEADGVRLHNLNVEVTGNEAGLDGESACALRVAPHLAIKLDNVSVRGTVHGLSTEEGDWSYPRSLPLGSLKPGMSHEFKARLVLPVPCRLVSRIDGLTIEPGRANGGPVEITLTLAPLPAGTRVRGEIWLQTVLLTRRIAVSGNVLKTAVGAAAVAGPLELESHIHPAPIDLTVPPSPRATHPAGVPAGTDKDPELAPTPTTSRPLGTVPLAPTVLVVSKLDDGTLRTLTEALHAAPTGARIHVRPGLYKESLVLSKRVEIVGDGARSDIILEGTDGPCLDMRADYAVVRGLTLHGRASPSGRPCPAVAVPQGQMVLEDCDISSDSQSGVSVRGTLADPVLRHCRIYDGRSAGVLFADQAEGMLEDCEVFGNALAGVEIRQGAKPTLRRCKIHDGQQAGVLVHDHGKGTLEDCEIFGNALAGVEVAGGGDPLLRRCKIHDGKYPGILVRGDGRGTVESCDIFGNALAGVEVREGGQPTLRSCRIHDGQQGGLLFTAKALGMVEDCDIGGHPLAGVTVRQGSAPTLRRCKVHHSRQAGILYVEKAKGLMEACDIFANGWAGVALLHDAEPLLRRCQVRDGELAGLVVAADAAGLIEDCEITGNAFVGVAISGGGKPVVRHCRIHDNGDVALWAYDKAGGQVKDCDLMGNTRGALDVAAGCSVDLKGNKTGTP